MNARLIMKPPRCLMFVPAVKVAKFGANAESLEVDGVIYDLEDSVAESAKDTARSALRNHFPVRSNVRTYLRINSFSTKHWAEDIRLAKEIKPDVIMLSKAESIEELRLLDETFQGCCDYFLVIETLRGFRTRADILTCSPRIKLFAIGYEDFCSECEIERPPLDAPTPLHHILMESLITAKEFRIPMMDAVSRKFHPSDFAELRREAEYGFKIGLCGKLAIHPNQVSIINNSYDDTLLRNRMERLTKSFSAVADGSAAILNEFGEMEDMPSLRLARKVLSREL